MAITLSHQSALDLIRMLRHDGISMRELDATVLPVPSAWVGKRLNLRNFGSDVWRWQQPTTSRPLHILVSSNQTRLRGKTFAAHAAYRDMPSGSVLWVDGHARVASPELTFLQMARQLSFPALVMLGHELCGHFARQADDPLAGEIKDGIPSATDVESLRSYLASIRSVKGLDVARRALGYVSDHAASAPEAVLSTMYGLPTTESGYGFGHVRLNERVVLGDSGLWERPASRYPDLMFGFAPVGLNYDGSKHFDVVELMALADACARSDGQAQDVARNALKEALFAARKKVIDDNLRNRQLAAQGRVVFSVTKEDLSDGRHLDELTRQVLHCAHNVFGVDVEAMSLVLEDTALSRDRWDLLNSLFPHGRSGVSSYGKL